jgi:putative ABC transport system permease protein
LSEHGSVPLDWGALAVATSLVLVAGLLSLVLRLNMERKVAVAAVRMVVQLLLVGYVLEWVFAIHSAPVLLPYVARAAATPGPASKP